MAADSNEVVVKILFYGRLADLIGPELEVDAPTDCSVAELRDRLAATHPVAEQALRGKHTRACIRDTIVGDDYALTAGDRVEFLPPVSGG